MVLSPGTKAPDFSLNQAPAGRLGIDPEWAAAALAEGRFEPRVREDLSSGVRSGVNGTPTFFINGQRYDGPVDLLLETLRQALISPSAH